MRSSPNAIPVVVIMYSNEPRTLEFQDFTGSVRTLTSVHTFIFKSSHWLPYVTGRCCQDAAEAESCESYTQVSTTCWWQTMRQQSLTLLAVNEHCCIFVAGLLSLNLCVIHAMCFVQHFIIIATSHCISWSDVIKATGFSKLLPNVYIS